MRYGYARVSTRDQHPEAQTDRLDAAGCDETFTDKGVSGSQRRRPKWDKLLRLLQPGDELVCIRLDRIGRSVANLLEIVAWLEDHKVKLIVLDQNIDTGTTMGKLLFHMLAAIAEFERDLIIERTCDGQATVRAMANMRRILGGIPPLGYFDPGPLSDDSRDWSIDQDAADWLADAADRVIAGEPVHAVWKSSPPMSDSAGRPITDARLRAALQRPASAGYIEIGGEILGTADVGRPPLDATQYVQLRRLFALRKTGRPAGAPDEDTGRARYPYGRDLRCGRCGNQLSGTPGYQRKGYYACRNPHIIGGVKIEPCRGMSVLASEVHELIAEFMASWNASAEGRAAAAAVPGGTAGRRAEIEADIADLSEQLADLMGTRLRQRTQLVRNKFGDLIAEARHDIEVLEAELDELDEIDAQAGSTAGIDWDELTDSQRREALAEAAQLPLIVRAGKTGPRPLSVADRIEILPRRS